MKNEEITFTWSDVDLIPKSIMQEPQSAKNFDHKPFRKRHNYKTRGRIYSVTDKKLRDYRESLPRLHFELT